MFTATTYEEIGYVFVLSKNMYGINRLISLKIKHCFTSLGGYVSPSLFLVSDRFRAHVWHPSTLDSRGSSSVFHR